LTGNFFFFFFYLDGLGSVAYLPLELTNLTVNSQKFGPFVHYIQRPRVSTDEHNYPEHPFEGASQLS
jgi:hypothetical protein